ncbi:retinol dehydrogenase 8-like [Sinocyclocheilus rhinocerous]|uniref:retinol dehydrogenase 8-like n=1 Tax=Sinocyclocheilus rhinocerous TaxID=307959 RepID=UPI0007BA0AA1|nr:PREDICTED: retinol dehydrogenase 8-like [Sinocyclocheilus rhinocerous]
MKVMGARKVLVTGCSSGIGLAVAVRLAKDELRRFKVVATMRDLDRREALEKAAGETLNRSLEIRQLDATCEDSIRECVNSLSDRRVDVLVNNAGVGMIGSLECQSVSDMQELFSTNFFGLVRLVKELLPDMKQRQSGHIVVMSSVLGFQGLLFNDVYAASKFAVEGFCESLAVQAMKFNLIVSKNPPFRHQTNRLYVPLTAMKHADPTGQLPIDAFYKMIFQHDRMLNATLSILRILHRRMGHGAA